MKNNEDLLRRLKTEAQQIEIPESLSPEQMKKKIKQNEAQKAAAKKKSRSLYGKVLAAAASVCLIVGAAGMFAERMSVESPAVPETNEVEEGVIAEVAEGTEEIKFPEVTYEEIYDSMKRTWEVENSWLNRGTGVLDEPTESGAADDVIVEMAAAEKSEMEVSNNEKLHADEYGSTNVQTVGVDEGDIAKNDGRYLYQIIDVETEGDFKRAIQIVDTNEGLTEAARIKDFDSVDEFYVWEDVLVVIESKFLDNFITLEKGMYSYAEKAYRSNGYHEISFYNIADRSQPKKIKTFTLQGDYASSRITDGYFYGFSRYYATPGEGAQDYDAYIPMVDGIRLQANQIYLPAESTATSYLVFVSIDMNNPAEFVQTMGIISGGDMYYVSSENIFVADEKYAEMKDGWNSDTTSLLRFSYADGKIVLQARGEVKGQLDNSFSMDEYNGYLRTVSTVREYKTEPVTDDRTGDFLGTHIVEERQTNALYVLDEGLNVVGKIEGLAEDEQIYSARFMGDTGYFVTFRQVDPLFTVDLADPENPKILSELKVSGFSEYLHIYGEDRLLGIGMEADEETGQQQGMKLSMFDVSDKSDVKEIAKYSLEKYNYSEALYNHRAVMISTGKNIFGFEVEGSNYGEYWRKYLVFSYEDDAFMKRLEVNAKNADGGYDSVRGTFIGDVFYLLIGDGSVRSYDLNTGQQLESLEP